MGMAIAPFDKPHPVMRIQPIAISASGALPDTLSSLPALPSLEGLTVRKLQLSMDPMLDMMGDADANGEIWRSGDGRNGSQPDDGPYGGTAI